MEMNVFNNKNATYSFVDLLKLFFSLCICLLHTEVFLDVWFGEWIETLVFRLAVPYFFVASGFFLGKKIYLQEIKTRKFIYKYMMRLSKKLLVFEAINLILYAFLWIVRGDGLGNILIKLVKSILFYPYGALWYMQAVIVAVLIVVPLIKKKKEWIGIILGFLGYLFALLNNRYYFIIANTGFASVVNKYLEIFISSRNGLFVGLIYISIGLQIAKNEEKVKSYAINTNIITVCLFVIYVFECFLLKDKVGIDDNSLYLTHMLLIPFLFVGSINANFLDKYNTQMARNLSTSIYLLHRPIIFIVTYGYYFITGSLMSNFVLMLIVLSILTIIICFVYRYKIKYLYDLII